MTTSPLSHTVSLPPTIAQLPSLVGQTVKLQGWLYKKRSSGKLLFLQLRDGTGRVQAVAYKPDLPEELFTLLDKHTTQECSLWVEGVVKEDTRSSLGVELSITHGGLIAPSVEYPITPKEHGVAFLMDRRHLWLRSSKQTALLRIRATVMQACRNYLNGLGFTAVDAPMFTPNSCEGTSTLFEVDYFDDTAFLSQSGQLYMEAAAMALGRVYCLGPVFRAEKSKTRRHLTEFWMLEPEAAFVEHEQNMALAEGLIRCIIHTVLEKHRDELATLERDTAKLEAVLTPEPFPRMSYDEAIATLHKAGRTDVQWGDDLGGDEETLISSVYDKPVIVERYPISLKPFYMKRCPHTGQHVLNMDILAPEGYGEIIGGSQREDDLEALEARLAEHGLDADTFGWYTDCRRYGSVPHSGFGLGIERMVAWVSGVPHVRECIPFPRLMERLRP
ncbi:MAG: asparagine--tRNA ligase [Vampirovibrionales bacterium]